LNRESFDTLLSDVRLASRGLLARPGFFSAAVATLALGMGASTAIFSVAYGVSVRPLPYPDAESLVRIYEANPAKNQLAHDVSVGAFDAWRMAATSLVELALFSKSRGRTVAGGDGARIITMTVSPAFFDVLGVRPMLGRGFKPEREYTRFTAADVILSYPAWQRLFGGQADVVGRTLALSGVGDDDVFTVVGVMPRAFVFTEPVDVWMPEIVEPSLARRLRSWRYDRVIGRLAPGSTIAQSRSALEIVAARLALETPEASAGWTVQIESLHRSVVGDFARATWLMFAAVAVVLLVACVNVGGLLIARAASRDRETVVRIALGASSWRLLRLWMVEAAMICGAGTVLGLLLARSGIAALTAARPDGIPRLEAIVLDGPALLVALGATLLAVAVFATAPLVRATRMEWSRTLRSRSDSASDGESRRIVRAALTAAQCAGAATLVVLGAMFTRSFVKLTSYDLGWNAASVVSFEASPRTPPELRRPWFARAAWADRLTSALETTPVIDVAAVTTQLPFGPAPFRSTIARGRGRSVADDQRWSAVSHHVTDRYFALMAMRLVEGRAFGRDDWFTEAEMIDSAVRPARGVAILSRTTARTLWPGESAIGQAIWLPEIDNVTWREVVGVIDDIQFEAVGEPPALHVFVPWMQDSAAARIYVLVKAGSSDTAAAATVARDLVQTTAPGGVIDQTASLESLVMRATARPRFTSRVVTVFAALALLLAAVGIYGTLSYLVGTRTREIGIRVALGASRSSVFSDVIQRGLVPAIGGALIGLAVAFALARTFRALLFEVEPLDPLSLAMGGLTLLLVAIFAALGPARRASGLDPVQALRVE
jgi:predicted permease